MNSYRKTKNAAKDMLVHGGTLEEKVLKTMKAISDLVGSTLGPSGRPVLIERQEYGLPHMFTKDGVTVFRNLGFTDPTAQSIMEAARDAAIRTASEAGDGPQPLWSKVLTPNGFIEMRDVKSGMTICGTNGTFQKVLGVYPKGKKEIVKVTFGNGQVVECCEDHLWSVTTNYDSPKTLTTKEISKNFKNIESDGHIRHRYFIPKTEVEFSAKEKLPLDPYLVGVLLGDGSLTDSGSVELSIGDKKEHIINKLTLPQGLFLKTTHVDDRNSFRVKIQGTDSNGLSIRDRLESAGLRSTNSYTKFIPKAYLLSSLENRKALLQGLIDTDGHINAKNRFEFSTVNEQLASDFTFLCQSLGISLYKTLHTRKENEGSYSKKPIYRFSELKGEKNGNKITDVKFTGEFTEMQCIKVSNPDNLYITDDFIVTHNTTSATVLAEAIVRYSSVFCKANPKVSPQKIVRKLEKTFKDVLEPAIKAASITATDEMLHAVAALSANGDKELADVVIEAYDRVGDNGSISILELTGPSKYEVEVVDGYPMAMGYEESCGQFFPLFLNDKNNNRCYIEKPVFILYFGTIAQTQTILPLMNKLVNAVFKHADVGLEKPFTPNIVLVATGFSESVIGDLSVNFNRGDSLNVFPLLLPKSFVNNGQQHLLFDMAAVTGAKVFDPITSPLETAELGDLGYGIQSFEATRYRSTIFGHCDDDLIAARNEELERSKASSESKFDLNILADRQAALTGGVAKLKVYGASSGELREKRDRAEDAVYAVRGAKKYGCLPGGCWMLMQLIEKLIEKEGYVFNPLNLAPRPYYAAPTHVSFNENDIIREVLIKALNEPIHKLLTNCGLNDSEIDAIKSKLKDYHIKEENKYMVYDAWNNKYVDALKEGILDSTPAVLEALRNSLSIASLLGTLGGTIVFQRDDAMERREAELSDDFMKASAGK